MGCAQEAKSAIYDWLVKMAFVTFSCPIIRAQQPVISWFHVQFIARNALQFSRNNCWLSNAIANIHEAKTLQP